jgi:hypothetical protein
MKNVNKILWGSIMILRATDGWAEEGDPCGVKIRITQQIAWGQTQRLQAIETLIATNTVENAAQGDYQAGRSITLLPGFTAKQGSTFTAQVKPCPCDQTELEGSRLTLTAYPNPFIESTVIRYQLHEATPVQLTVVDEQGRVVEVLADDKSQEVGAHEYTYRNASLPEAVYLYSLRTKEGVITRRLVKSH